jgi:DNA-binding CsgD family transcriptional regulator
MTGTTKKIPKPARVWDGLAMAALADSVLLEREPELAALRPVLEAAREGAGRLVVVEGPPGIGKTRLLATTRALAADAGLNTLWGCGGEFERDFPYGVALQLFEPLLGRHDREELLGGAARLAAPLLDSSLAAPAAGPDGSFATGHGLYWLLVNLSAQRPVLVAIDDLHWVDPPTLRFLAYLERRLDGLPVVLVCGLRPGEAHAGDPPPATVVDDPGRVVLRPRPLTGPAVARFVALTLGHAPEPAFAEACERASGGNPLLLRELLIALRAEGTEQADAVPAVGSQALAGRVRMRLGRLGRPAAELAAAAAVLGDGASLRIAAELAAVGGEAAADASARLVREDVVRLDDSVPGGAVFFAHPIVRAAVYGDLGPERRARLHAEAARLIAAAGAAPERVAAHLLHAPPAGDAWAVGELRRAAQRALSEGAADAAARDLRRALAEPPPAAELPAVLLELGIAELHANPSAAIEPLEEALALTLDPDARAETTLELSRALSAAGRIQDAVDALGRGLDDLRAAPERLARLEAELIGLSRFLPERYAFAAERLERIRLPLRPEGEPLSTGEAMLLANLASHAVRAGRRREEAIAIARQALAGGRLLAELTSPTYAIAVQALAWADELEPAIALYDEGLADARARGAISRFTLGSAFRAGVAYRLGALDEAEADARAALDNVEAEGVHVARFWAAAFLVDTMLERDEVAEAAAVLDPLPISDHPAGAYFLHAARESRARLRLAQGRAGEAVHELLAFGRDLEAIGIVNPGISPWRSTAAIALLQTGEPERARELAAEEVALARAWGAPRALGVALRASGLARADVGALEEAVEVLSRSPARLEHARAAADLGAALRRAGRRVDAREPLRVALELAHACGATALASRARTELVASGAKPRRQALSGADSLTPSERRVTTMAAEGLTNRDIAQRLFVTPKTVEVHLSSAYRKLAIGSRTQLSEALGGAAALP